MESFEKCNIDYIHREQNSKVDLLSKLVSTKSAANNGSIIQEEVEEPSISESNNPVICLVEQDCSWQKPIKEHLLIKILPEDEKEAKKLKRATSFYTIVVGELYHWAYS